MKTVNKLLNHEFVEFIPNIIENDTIYISISFATATHLCCCGCGIKVVTPFSPSDWKLTFDGESISLHPSIGNWQFPCRSHYWIRENKVVWVAENWKDKNVVFEKEIKESQKNNRRVIVTNRFFDFLFRKKL